MAEYSRGCYYQGCKTQPQERSNICWNDVGKRFATWDVGFHLVGCDRMSQLKEDNSLPVCTILTRALAQMQQLWCAAFRGAWAVKEISHIGVTAMLQQKTGLYLIFWASSNIYSCGMQPERVQWTKAGTNRFKTGPPPRDAWGRQEMLMRAKRWGMREEGGIHVQTNTSLEFYTALRCSVFGFQAALQY